MQWSIGYLAGAWVLLQVLDLLGKSFHWPESVVRIATVLLGGGFVVALIVAWYHGEKGRQKVTALEAVMISAVLAAAVTGAVLVSKTPASSHDAATPKAPSDGVEQGSIAVLPFVNRSADPANEYFSDGISEEILSALARIPGLEVRARTSSFAFKNKSVPMRDIARQLGVAHVLEGSVQRSGDRVRITAQLLDARTDRNIWSESFDREMKDIFAVEDEISHAISEALRVRLVTTSPANLPPVRTDNTEAHEQYLRGRYLLAKGSEEAVAQSFRSFQRAIQLDPNYAAAHAGLAEAFLLSTPWGPTSDQIGKARASARKALELDDRQADAYAVLGAVLLWYDWDLSGSERALRRALELDPNAGNARDYYAWTLIMRGQPDSALLVAREAFRKDPLSAWLSYALEFRYVQVRDYDRVFQQQRVTAELDPNHFFWDLPIGIAYREKGEFDKAVAEYRRIEQHLGGRPLHGLAITYARMGRTDDARAILRRLEADARRRYVPPEQIAMIYANLGDKDRAMKWLETAYETRSGWLLGWAQVDPSYDPLRSDPRFQSLMKRMPLR